MDHPANSFQPPVHGGRLPRLVPLALALTLLVLARPLEVRCAPAPSTPLCAIHGDLVSDAGAHTAWVVFERDSGMITAVCERDEDVPPEAATLVYDGYVFPGLIDTHNHGHWNAIPMWRPGRTYENRYEWQESDAYQEQVRSRYTAIVESGLWAQSLKYGEVRAMVGGTTMIQGTDGADWGYLVRNLDYYGWLAGSYVDDVTQMDPELIDSTHWAFDNGYLLRLFLHVAEGKSSDSRAQAEFPFLVQAGLARPGVVIIHGVALTAADFATMAGNGMYLVWSPKSNEVLYGETVDVVAALAAGVTVALGPDWSITGSDNLLEELKVAYEYSLTHLDGAVTPRQLFRMVTSDAAEVAGVNDPCWFRLGKIEAGYQADLFLAPRYAPDPHLSLIKTYSRDIRLVLIDGKAIYGDRHLLAELGDEADLESLVVAHRHKQVDVIEPAIGPLGEQSWSATLQALATLGWPLAPLVEDEPGACPGFPRGWR